MGVQVRLCILQAATQYRNKGKTSIAMRFADDQFSQVYKQTVGVDFFIRRLTIPRNQRNYKAKNNFISSQISDRHAIMGYWWAIHREQDDHKLHLRSSCTSFNMNSHAHLPNQAVLLCYDITNYESFANLEDWYRLVTRTFQNSPMPYVALVGNKSTTSCYF